MSNKACLADVKQILVKNAHACNKSLVIIYWAAKQKLGSCHDVVQELKGKQFVVSWKSQETVYPLLIEISVL